MSEWPPHDLESVYVPPKLPAPPMSEAEQRVVIATARIRQGLSVSDAILSEVLAFQRSASQR